MQVIFQIELGVYANDAVYNYNFLLELLVVSCYLES